MKNKPIIGITMGDAAGISPEIIVKSLLLEDLYHHCCPVVLGDARIIERSLEAMGLSAELGIITQPANGRFEPRIIDIIDYHDIDLENLRYGVVSASNGKAAVKYTIEAGRMCLDGRLDAMTSAPLNKESMRAAGYKYEGQTQILKELCNSPQVGMVLLLGELRLMLLSTHLSLRDACDAVKKEAVLEKIRLAAEALSMLGICEGKIAVAALNPHASDGGQFGWEEQREMIPAIEQARAEGINVEGPYPADTVFVRASQGEFDLTIAAYHDQGLMATKLLGFGQVVTLLAGLPIIRTSTGHGTAFDIAWKGMADHRNLYMAIKTAAKIVKKKLSALTGNKIIKHR